MFKNLIAYRLKDGWNVPVAKLEAALAKTAGRRIGATERTSHAWAPVIDGELVLSVQRHRFIRLRIEEKILPSSVIKKELNKRCKTIEDQTGRKPGKKEARDLKEEIEREMLPKAFVKEKFVNVWIDAEGVWLGIEATSTKTADLVISCMLAEIDGLPAMMRINTARSPAGTMEVWLRDGAADNGFELDDHCELKGHGDVQPIVRYAKLDLNREDIRQHMVEGKMPRSLGLVYEDSMACVVNDSLDLKKIELIGFKDDNEDAGLTADLLARGEIFGKVLNALVESCGGFLEGDRAESTEEESEPEGVEV